MARLEYTKQAPPGGIGFVGADIQAKESLFIPAGARFFPLPISIGPEALPPWIQDTPVIFSDALSISQRSLTCQLLLRIKKSTLENIHQKILSGKHLQNGQLTRFCATAFADNFSPRSFYIEEDLDLFRLHTEHPSVSVVGDELVKLVETGCIFPYPEAKEGRDFFFVRDRDGNRDDLDPNESADETKSKEVKKTKLGQIVGISVPLNIKDIYRVPAVNECQPGMNRKNPIIIPPSGTAFRELLSQIHLRIPNDQRTPGKIMQFIYETANPIRIGQIDQAENIDLVINRRLSRDPYGEDLHLFVAEHLPARYLDGVIIKNGKKVIRSDWPIRVEVSGYADLDEIAQYMILTVNKRTALPDRLIP